MKLKRKTLLLTPRIGPPFIPTPVVSTGPNFREEEGEGGVVHHVFSLPLALLLLLLGTYA